MTSYNRIRRQNDSSSACSSQLRVLFRVSFYNKFNCEDILLIERLNSYVFSNSGTYCELIFCAHIYPLADLVSLLRYGRVIFITNGKITIDIYIDRFKRSAIFIEECNSVDDFVFSDYCLERLGHYSIRCDNCLRPVYNPLGVISRHLANYRELVANLFSCSHLNCYRHKWFRRNYSRIECDSNHFRRFFTLPILSVFSCLAICGSCWRFCWCCCVSFFLHSNNCKH